MSERVFDNIFVFGVTITVAILLLVVSDIKYRVGVLEEKIDAIVSKEEKK